MKLSNEDIIQFYRLYHPLLIYVNEKNKIINGLNSPEDFKNYPIKEIKELRDRLYEQPELINQFISENPLNFSENDIQIVSVFRNYIKGKFFILRYLKNYTVFLDDGKPAKAYGVTAITSTFEEMIGPSLPIMVEAVLLPFRGKIIYDSIFMPYSIGFGSGIRRSINNTYEEAKNRYGIITSLPFSQKEEETDIGKLKFYVKNIDNRTQYQEEIAELISKDRHLLVYYHQEMGRQIARTRIREIRKTGISKGWFAMLEGITIASGDTKEEVEKNIKQIVPLGKKDFVYIFQLK